MKKQGKRSKKKHLSKEAFRKMRYKQNMWRVYKHTGKDTDYEVYKEALNCSAINLWASEWASSCVVIIS